MTPAAPARRAPAPPPEPVAVRPAGEAWPRGVSREPAMRISDVLAVLGPDFPALTPSKLRFLEDQGLVEPRRSPGGYRQYSPADVERVRYVLREQRDRYLPLKVIAEQLAALDAGSAEEALVPRLAASDGERTGSRSHRSTLASVAEAAGVAPEVVTDLVAAGVLMADAGGHLDPWAIEVVQVAVQLAEYGVDARHLRTFRTAADRQVVLVDQIAAPLRGQRSGAGGAHAATVAAEAGELCARLHAAMVRAGIARLGP